MTLVVQLFVRFFHVLVRLFADSLHPVDLIALVVQVFDSVQKSLAIALSQSLVRSF
jgi:hypothetical protein